MFLQQIKPNNNWQKICSNNKSKGNHETNKQMVRTTLNSNSSRMSSCVIIAAENPRATT